MLSKIIDFLSPARVPLHQPISFKEISKDDIAVKYPDALHDLFIGNEVGFLIKNFLDEHQVDKILSNFEQVFSKDPAYTDVGFTYPTVFAEYSNSIKDLDESQQEKRIKEYFSKNADFKENFEKNFGINLPKIITEFFNKISGNRKIKVPYGIGNAGQYPFATFRFLVPQSGMMAVHCGNYFQGEFLKFYNHLSQTVDVKDQMSFFIMLQEPESGGELTVFNFLWEEGQSKVDTAEDKEILLADGKKYFIDKDKKMQYITLRPKAGDMILFQGGKYWHRVKNIVGQQNRITFGGFMGFSKDRSRIYYWS